MYYRLVQSQRSLSSWVLKESSRAVDLAGEEVAEVAHAAESQSPSLESSSASLVWDQLYFSPFASASFSLEFGLVHRPNHRFRHQRSRLRRWNIRFRGCFENFQVPKSHVCARSRIKRLFNGSESDLCVENSWEIPTTIIRELPTNTKPPTLAGVVITGRRS